MKARREREKERVKKTHTFIGFKCQTTWDIWNQLCAVIVIPCFNDYLPWQQHHSMLPHKWILSIVQSEQRKKEPNHFQMQSAKGFPSENCFDVCREFLIGLMRCVCFAFEIDSFFWSITLWFESISKCFRPNKNRRKNNCDRWWNDHKQRISKQKTKCVRNWNEIGETPVCQLTYWMLMFGRIVLIVLEQNWDFLYKNFFSRSLTFRYL